MTDTLNKIDVSESYEQIAREINPKLKPCPFCGSSASLYYTTDNKHLAYVRCNGTVLPADGGKSCYAEIAPYKARYRTAEEAIEAWNRRFHRYDEE